MWRTVRPFVLAAVFCAAGVIAAGAGEEKTQIPGGVPGKIMSVDTQGGSLTVVTDQGAQRTFSVTDQTTMVGPRGGKVRRRLKDPRFHEGMPVTIVADGKTATEIHLGYARDMTAGGTSGTGTGAAGATAGSPARVSKPAPEDSRAVRTSKKVDVTANQNKSMPEADDQDTEVPGKVKTLDRDRRVLVITTMNGKERSFLLPKDVDVLVRGAKSKRGLNEPAIRSGAAIEVVTDEGGHKVKELKIVSARR